MKNGDKLQFCPCQSSEQILLYALKQYLAKYHIYHMGQILRFGQLNQLDRNTSQDKIIHLLIAMTFDCEDLQTLIFHDWNEIQDPGGKVWLP